jgi:hypothetical protein
MAAGNGHRICGMSRRIFVSICIIFALSVVFTAIGVPILKSIIWKINSNSSNVSSGNNSGDSKKPNVSKWVDSDTPKELHTKKMEDGTEYQLVFSDEFNKDGRDFHPGKDKIW